MPQNRKDWVFVLITVSLITVIVLWDLHLNTQHILLFFAAPVIALGTVMVMVLLPKCRQRLAVGLQAHSARQKELKGWFYRYRRIAFSIFSTLILTLLLLRQYQFLPALYMPWSVAIILITVLALDTIQNTGLRAAGWLGLLVIVVLIAFAVLRFLPL